MEKGDAFWLGIVATANDFLVCRRRFKQTLAAAADL
jgi:hypothetical protein